MCNIKVIKDLAANVKKAPVGVVLLIQELGGTQYAWRPQRTLWMGCPACNGPRISAPSPNNFCTPPQTIPSTQS